MKKFVMVVVVLLYSFIGVNMVFADTWTQKADFGGVERQAPFSFSIGNKGYIGAGQTNFPNIIYNDFWEYDPATDTWTQKADFGGLARSHAVGFSIGSKGYAGTGNTSTGQWVFAKDFWVYDPATNTWTQKADFGGVGRFGAIGFSINNKGYIGTGEIGFYYQTNDFWEYDPTTDTWTQKADFGGGPRVAAVGFSIGNKGYVGTGANENDGTKKDFWEYDPATDTWTQKADFAVESYCTGLSIENKGYIGIVYPYFGGTYTNYFAEYDPATDTWTQKADFGGISRSGAASFSIGNIGYIGMGGTLAISSTEWVFRKDFWEYDPNGGSNNIILVPVANKTSLWPPNNKMIPITIWSNVSSSLPVTLTVQISCNEPPKRDNDWTEPVIDQATGVISLSLRATREGSGTGRIYTITITATDANGNSATETIDIVVPHDQGNN